LQPQPVAPHPPPQQVHQPPPACGQPGQKPCPR
jgi:hypothetical protein